MKKMSFQSLDKHKYLFFMLVSLATCLFASFCVQLCGDTFSLNAFIHNTFICWGFTFPVGFVIYEVAAKANRKRTGQEAKRSFYEKFRYPFIMLFSLFAAVCLGFVVLYGSDDPLTLKCYLDTVLLCWGFMYPGSFVMDNELSKQYKEMAEQGNSTED